MRTRSPFVAIVAGMRPSAGLHFSAGERTEHADKRSAKRCLQLCFAEGASGGVESDFDKVRRRGLIPYLGYNGRSDRQPDYKQVQPREIRPL